MSLNTHALFPKTAFCQMGGQEVGLKWGGEGSNSTMGGTKLRHKAARFRVKPPLSLFLAPKKDRINNLSSLYTSMVKSHFYSYIFNLAIELQFFLVNGMG